MTMTRIEYRLHAFDLASRRGFADGNIFGHLLREKLGKLAPDKRVVLVECVKRYLISAFPRRLTTVLSRTHNPIRIPDETIDDFEDLTVSISENLVLKVAEEISATARSQFTPDK